jgi:hypothetical protein
MKILCALSAMMASEVVISLHGGFARALLRPCLCLPFLLVVLGLIALHVSSLWFS